MKSSVVTVGIRDLRNNLSRYVERAKKGEVIAVTDHGTEVALLVPRGPSGARGLWSLVAAGHAEWSGQPAGLPDLSIPNRGGDVAAEVIAERDDRLR